ncbi:MAG: hypothetical protein ABI810_06420 [Sphingomonas bacterium]
MDHDRARHGVLIFAAAGLLTAAAPADPPLRAERWLAPAARLTALTREPAECLGRPGSTSAAKSIAIGRAAFRAPLLLGGQAARAGLSCSSCHRNGHGNPDFLFPGISGAPGTADVTASLLSSHRGDGIFNPRPIPDLAGPAAARKVSRERGDPALAAFITGLITQEFDGPEPPPRVLAGVVDYVRALSPEGCGGDATVPITLKTHLGDIRRALDAAEIAWRVRDKAATRLLIGSARSSLGAIDERYAAPGLAQSRARLEDADLALAAIQRAIDTDPARVALRMAAWRGTMPQWTKPLIASERESLFDPGILRTQLN